MVGADVRQVEAEIDGCIRKMPIFNVKRDVLLQRLMTIWRDGLEVVHLRYAHAAMFQLEEGLKNSLAIEYLISTGAYQSIKWAMEYARDDGLEEVSDKALIDVVMTVPAPYVLLVDALKLGSHDRAEFSVDHGSKILTIYEGGNVSGHDSAIVRRDHITVPFHKQSPLVEDSDQLTTGWTAGEYRRYWRWLRSIVERAQTETIMAQAGPVAPMQEIMKRSVVVEIPSPPAPLERVQEDLTLTTAKACSSLKWKIDSWHDCPFIQIGDRVFGVSAAILTVAGSDDYMLRAAVRNDPRQYEKVSGLREERMIKICKKAFSEAEWTFTPHHHLANPPKEIDGYATKGSDICIVQLKSTIKPQSPWEVYKRNTDVIEGITHTAELVRRVGEAATGIVITDGYEGDYATWKESLATGIPVASLKDLDWIVKNPRSAFKILAERAGIEGDSAPEPLPERSGSLCGWGLRILDESKPSGA
jgi:hypothetical protein